MGDKPKDSLTIVGVNNVPVSNEIALHFVREVKAREEPDELSGAFSEDTWFVEGKGLVRLVQKRQGKVAMTWILEKFSQ
jgi:hypothetical protein